MNGMPERGIHGLKWIVDNYGSSDAGDVARLYLANAYYFTGQFDEALKQYEKFSGGVDMMKAAAYAGAGACYEAKHDYDRAASSYERAAGVASQSGMVPEYLSLAGRCYGLAGQKEKAVTILKRVKTDFPTSPLAREVDRYIAQFSA